MSGAATPRGEEPGRLSGARAEFVSSLPRRLELLRSSLDALGQAPTDSERLNGLLRRIHALGSSARVLGFASVAEALSEAERGLRGAISGGRPLPLEDVARAFDLLPSLLAGASGEGGERQAFPISVLVFGPQGVADAIAEGEGVSVECERTEDATRARELARIIGPDVAVIDADRRGAREIVELFVNDPLIEPVPVLVIGSFATPEAATPFVELGATRVLPKPVSPEALRKTIDELRDLATRPRPARAPLGELTVTALSERMAEELRRGLVEAVEPGSMSFPVPFGEGTDVMAAVWSAVARVRELVTLRSQGAVRFQPVGPEGAVPLAPFGGEERRAGERLPKVARSSDGVSIHGRRIVVADDDPAVVWFMTSLLKAVGAEVIEAHDGRRALEITRETWPDAVISDVLMPELDGFSLCREIKRDVAVRDTPVILLSWKEDLLQRLRELGADADGYLRKEAAASAVVERVREVLRPRARVEQRIEAGGEVRGRLDGLTPRLLIELVCKHRKDARISVRDAVYLWELSLREGRLLSITRSSAQGDFTRGSRVLPGLLGVTAGRFAVEPDSTPTRAEFEGDIRAILKEPIERARAALNAVTADSLVRIKGLTFDREGFDPYLACTPEPALGLLRRLFAAAEPRELVQSGQADPRLLESILSDLARRGVITGVEREPSASLAPPGKLAAAPAVSSPATDETDLDWDDDDLSDDDVAPAARARRSSRPPKKSERPAEAQKVEPSPAPPEAKLEETKPAPATAENLTVTGSSGMPLNAEPTPAVDWTVGPLFAFGNDEPGTLRGIGTLPAVQKRLEAKPEPAPVPPRPAPSAEPPRVKSPPPSPVAPPKASSVASPEPPAATAPKASPVASPEPVAPSPEPSLAAEGSDFATLLALTATPAPATAAAVEPTEASAKPPAAKPEDEEPAAKPEEPEAKPEEPVEKAEAPEPTRAEEPAEKPEAPLEPVAPAPRVLAGTKSSEPSASPDVAPSESPPSREEAEFIDSSSVASVPPSDPPPEEGPEPEEEREPLPPKKAKEPKPEAKAKAEAPAKAEPEKSSGLRAALGGVISFAVVFAFVKFVVLRPAAEVTTPSPAPSAATRVAPPAATPKAATGTEPVIETMAVPSGLHTPAGHGWLQIEVPGPEALYVDGTIMGRGPSRRVPLPPGKHQVKIGEGQGPSVKRYEVEITAATVTRLSLPAPAQRK